MPLRITNSTTDVAVINRWAEDIETRLNATVKQAGHALTSIKNLPTSSNDVESIGTNKQTGTAYTVVVSDLDTLITLNNNAGGTVTLPGPGAVFSFVQSVSFSASADSSATTVTHGQGNFVYLTVMSARSFVNTTFTVTDTQLNTWTQIDAAGDSSAFANANWFTSGVSAGANTITVTAVHGAGGSALINPTLVEYSGIKTISPLDVHAVGTGTAVSVTTGFNNDLAIFSTAFSQTAAMTAVAPWILRYDVPNNFIGRQHGQDQI